MGQLKLFKVNLILLFMVLLVLPSCFSSYKNKNEISSERNSEMKNSEYENAKDFKDKLTPEQYHILFEKGTERPFSGKYWDFEDDGYYNCAACGAKLFDSTTKFDAGCGWPSFNDVLSNENIITRDDYSFNMHRIEVMCAKCGGHLGHLFDDGPRPTGLRYCINSASIDFEQRNEK